MKASFTFWHSFFLDYNKLVLITLCCFSLYEKKKLSTWKYSVRTISHHRRCLFQGFLNLTSPCSAFSCLLKTTQFSWHKVPHKLIQHAKSENCDPIMYLKKIATNLSRWQGVTARLDSDWNFQLIFVYLF
jgi:hypothetical protein